MSNFYVISNIYCIAFSKLSPDKNTYVFGSDISSGVSFFASVSSLAMAAVSDLMINLAAMSKDQILFALQRASQSVAAQGAGAINEHSLLTILGEYANDQLSVRKSTARDFIYNNHGNEYYAVLRILRTADGAPAPSDDSMCSR